MLGILRLAQKIADSSASILIEGETGTGKGLLAAEIHQASHRRKRSFVQVNCAALPEQLLESELFGHVVGAFTGAVREKIGLFKEAEGGTIFLDEVDKTTSAVQAKLLHVLDKKEIRPVGSTKWVTVDTRVVCATNVDLRDWIKQGKFLEDLYYRLNDFSIRVPALRERREDIPLLVNHFLQKYAAQYGKPTPALTSAVLQTLIDASWRGNVRELEKTVKRMVVLVDDGAAIDVDLLPPELVASPGDNGNGKRTLRAEVERTERRVIGDALRNAGWNKARVARELKISYPSLLKKIREFGLDRRVKTH
jgi:transcriptional regulator with PAS, ATPase and Fis domain